MMPIFKVEVEATEVRVYTYIVGAKDEATARAAYFTGDGDDGTWVDTISEEVIEITEIEG
jgi:hypothetical protein